MIVYHIGGKIVAWHRGGQDAPKGSYPGAARRVIDDAAFLAVAPDADGVVRLPAALLAVSADDVRAEASRRMQALVGARDAHHLEIIIANGTREAVRLLRLAGERAWTPEEAMRAALLEQLDAGIEAIRAASNAMESDPPTDYAADNRWP